MKKGLIFLLLVISSQLIIAQNIKTDDFEVYLNDYNVSEINISKGMYMTQNMQYFYEGVIEVVDINVNKSNSYRFFFSKWDEKFKEFLVKDNNYKGISPDFTYTYNSTIKYIDNTNKEVSVKLSDTRSVDYSILSSMLVWLESTVAKKKTEAQPETVKSSEK